MEKCRWKNWQGIPKSVRFLACVQGLLENCGCIRLVKLNRDVTNAAGCILALCCDYRFIAQGHKMIGLNEVKLGLPVPYLPDRLLHALAGIRRAREMMESGNEKILNAVIF